jgi:hypothetical protein
MMRKINIRVAKYFLVLTVILILYPITCKAQADNSQDIVAQIENNSTINFSELQKYVTAWHYEIFYNRDKAALIYRKSLDEMIMRQLKLIDFFNLGLEKDKKLLQSIRRVLNEELVIQYFQTQFYEKYINERAIQKEYGEMGKEVICQQIVLKKAQNASKKDIDSLKEAVHDIEAKINRGMDFSKLAKKYSQDEISAPSGGFIPALRWNTSLSDPIKYKIFHLHAGEVQVLENRQQFIIVKVLKINNIHVQPFIKVKDEIVKALEGRYARLSQEEFETVKNNVVDTLSLQWNKSGLRKLVQWSNIPDFYKTSYQDTIQHAIEEGQNIVILKHSRGKVDLKEYLRLLNEVLTIQKVGSINESQIKEFLLEAVRTNAIVLKANKLNLENSILNIRTKNPVVRTNIPLLYNTQEIEKRIPEATDDALKQFYAENKDSLFYQLAKINIYAMIDSNKKTIEDMQLKLQQNVPFEQLGNEILVKTFIRDSRVGVIKSYLSPEKPFLGEAAFKLKISEIAGPIKYNDPDKGTRYAFIKCVAKREEKQLTYEDVQTTITKDYIDYYREKITRMIHEKLKQKYKVIIYEEVLKQNLSRMGANP